MVSGSLSSLCFGAYPSNSDLKTPFEVRYAAALSMSWRRLTTATASAEPNQMEGILFWREEVLLQRTSVSEDENGIPPHEF